VKRQDSREGIRAPGHGDIGEGAAQGVVLPDELDQLDGLLVGRADSDSIRDFELFQRPDDLLYVGRIAVRSGDDHGTAGVGCDDLFECFIDHLMLTSRVYEGW
jgi:hypothetical protein